MSGTKDKGRQPTEAELTFLRANAPAGMRAEVMALRLHVGAQRVRQWCDDHKIPRRHFVKGIGTRIGVCTEQHHHERRSGSPKPRTRAPSYPWLLTSATTPATLARHRELIERDCFSSEPHRALLREAAAEYDAMIERTLANLQRPTGRPRSHPRLAPVTVGRKRAA